MPRRAIILVQDDSTASDKPVYLRDVSPAASLFDRLCFTWHEARVDAYLAFEEWRCEQSAEAYLLYLAAQDRADTVEDALAGCATLKSE